MSLPEAYVQSMKELLNEDYEAYRKSFEEKRIFGLRVNTRKISVERFLEITPFTVWPIPWIDNGFYYDGTVDSPAKHPYYHAGLYYLQEPSAMTPANRLSIQKDNKVLDLCAAPGGKSTELASKLIDTGILFANDISTSRARILVKNLELCGAGNICVLSEEPKNLVKQYAGYFDKILIDAPCSGEGMFRKDLKMIKSWEEQGPQYYAKIQKELIMQAAEMLKPGGKLLYSTCTFSKLENEDVINFLLTSRDDFELSDIEPYEGFTVGKFGLEKVVRIFPHKMRGEGHFLALLSKHHRKTYDNKDQSKRLNKSKKLPKEFEEFWKQTLEWDIDPDCIQNKNDKLYYLPEGDYTPVTKMRILRSGLLLGEIKKNRFEPSQALAMHLQAKQAKNKIDFSLQDIRVIKYLKGETLDLEDCVSSKDKGWYLICVDNYPLGFGKVVNQSLKNKYATGWRWQSS